MDWHYISSGQQQGPVSESDLMSLIREGRLGPGDYVWNATMGNRWSRAGDIHSLFPPAAAASSAPGAAGTASSAAPARMPRNAEITRRARESLQGQWGLAAGAVFLYWLLSLFIAFIPFGSVILAGPFLLGLSLLFLTMSRAQPVRTGMLFDGFHQFGAALGGYILSGLLVFLWTLLLIVPGIVAALRYSMMYFIICDNPGIGPLDAIRESKRIMTGRKAAYLCLNLRFVGWILLAILTLGIGFLWVFPYMMAARAHFYEEARARAEA